MSALELTVHRATRAIGGNCIELINGEDERLLLDVGRPLDAPEDMHDGLLPETVDTNRPVAGVLLSHPHQDHYGLLNELPADWPVFSGAASERLIRLTSGIFGEPPRQRFQHWTSEAPFSLGSFTITPLLTDHSAFDAHMLLVEAAGRRVLYSGDFRMHGRKKSLVERLLRNPPADIDVLLLEGTNLGSDKSCVTEDALEADFAELFRETPGRVFVAWSAQNVDHTVSLYRACLKTRRTLVVDLYTAEALELLAPFARIPQPGWPNFKVVITGGLTRMYRKRGREDFVERMASKHGIAARTLNEYPQRWAVMVRPSLIRDYAAKDVEPNSEDAWCWSMWRGYLAQKAGEGVQEWFDGHECPARHIHTSGHAAPADLKRFAERVGARRLVPIHGVAWDSSGESFPAVERLDDAQALAL